MQLQPNERLISNNDTLYLTDRRIMYEYKSEGFIHKMSIGLEAISSVQLKIKSYPILLFSAAICFAGAGYNYLKENTQDVPVLAGAMVIFLLIWIIFRSKVLSIQPHGGQAMSVSIGRLRTENIDDFYQKIQLAKHDRLIQLKTS